MRHPAFERSCDRAPVCSVSAAHSHHGLICHAPIQASGHKVYPRAHGKDGRRLPASHAGSGGGRQRALCDNAVRKGRHQAPDHRVSARRLAYAHGGPRKGVMVRYRSLPGLRYVTAIAGVRGLLAPSELRRRVGRKAYMGLTANRHASGCHSEREGRRETTKLVAFRLALRPSCEGPSQSVTDDERIRRPASLIRHAAREVLT